MLWKCEVEDDDMMMIDEMQSGLMISVSARGSILAQTDRKFAEVELCVSVAGGPHCQA